MVYLRKIIEKKNISIHHDDRPDHKPVQLQSSQKLFRHVVMFKFKDGTSAEDIKKVENAFADLPKKDQTIKGFEFGTNNSPEGLNQGFFIYSSWHLNQKKTATIIYPIRS